MALKKIRKARNCYDGTVVVIDVKSDRKIARIQRRTARAWGITDCRSVDPLFDDCDPDILYLQFREDLDGTYRLSLGGSTYWFACGGIVKHFSKTPKGTRREDSPLPVFGSIAFQGVREKKRFVRINLREVVSPL